MADPLAAYVKDVESRRNSFRLIKLTRSTLWFSSPAMKFGRRFPRRQVLKWTAFCLDYKTLKTLSKAACLEADASWRQVLDALYRDTEKVEHFYIDQLQIIQREKKELYDKYDIAQDAVRGAFSVPAVEEDLEALRKSLFKISADIVEIQRFGALNKEGVSRILSKVHRSGGPNVPEATKCHDKTNQLAFCTPDPCLYNFADCGENHRMGIEQLSKAGATTA